MKYFAVFACLLLVSPRLAASSPHLGFDDETERLFRQFFRREAAEREDDATTTATVAAAANSSPTTTTTTPKPATVDRVPPSSLYPQLPPSGVFVPPFGPHGLPGANAGRQVPPQFSAAAFGASQPSMHRGHWGQQPAPLPFGPPPSQIAGMQPSVSGRQADSFADGLGKRLLALVGVDPAAAAAAASNNTFDSSNQSRSPVEQALQNDTLVQQLNKGMHSVYSNLSKMWNSTVQQQLNLLQDKFKKHTENATSAHEQNVAQQVPNFFKAMATRIGEAQENLNKVWSQVMQAAQNQSAAAATPQVQQRSNNQGNFLDDWQQDNFFRSLGFQQPSDGSSQRPMLGNQLTDFWHNQVTPQVNKVRSMIARTWQDLSQSGTRLSLGEAPVMYGGRMRQPQQGADVKASDQTLDSLVEGINLNGPEYRVDSSGASGDKQPPPQQPQNSHLNERLTEMQKDINKMWLGLTGSLQNALNNVNTALNPQQQQQQQPQQMFVPFSFNLPPRVETRSFAAQPSIEAQMTTKKEVDRSENEVRQKIGDLAGAQKNADRVYIALQRQQAQNRIQAAQNNSNLFGDFDLANLDRMPIVAAVRDFWSQAPTRLESFMQNTRQKQPSQSSTTTITTTSTTTQPETTTNK